MIDIHCHVLHGIDDGADNLQDAVRLCSIAESQGLTDIIVTPHFADYEQVGEFIALRDEKLGELRDALKEEEIELNIQSGCELYLDEMIFAAPDLDGVTLGNSRYMLCEFSLNRFYYADALDWLDVLIDRGYTPILAHPERYKPFMHEPAMINEFASRNILFQLNMDSLTGGNGRHCFKLACEMLEKNLVDFIASDAHSPDDRPNDLLTKSKYLPDFVDYAVFEKLLEGNPKKVLNNELIEIPERGII